MNIFITDHDIEKCVASLDDKRLNKQILECKTILGVALENKAGYAKHPVVAYYKDYPAFVWFYAVAACYEYEYRFGKRHACLDYLFAVMNGKDKVADNIPDPLYVQGSKGTEAYVYTTDPYEVVARFRVKLRNKWDTDKYAPKWTKRDKPVWAYQIMEKDGFELL